MDRFAVLVDAGYLLSQSVQIVSGGRSRYRRNVAITDPEGLIAMIVAHSKQVLGNPNLLRVYWYDGVSGKLSAEQEALSLLPDVQLRHGTISRSGVQKGVDSKIIADLIELSGNHAMSDAVLVTGDGDLVIGIELAQKRGVRVGILGLEDMAQGISHNQSFEVVCMADRVRRLSAADIQPYLRYVPSAGAAPTVAIATVQAEPAAAAVPASTPESPKPAAQRKAPARKTTAKKATARKGRVAEPAPLAEPPPVAELPATPPAESADLPEKPRPARQAKAEPAVLAQIVQQFIAAADPPFTADTVTPTGAIGQAVDGKLLQTATAALGRRPMPSERAELRKLLREQLTQAG